MAAFLFLSRARVCMVNTPCIFMTHPMILVLRAAVRFYHPKPYSSFLCLKGAYGPILVTLWITCRIASAMYSFLYMTGNQTLCVKLEQMFNFFSQSALEPIFSLFLFLSFSSP